VGGCVRVSTLACCSATVAAVSVLNVYYANNGICILLLIARCVRWLV
jgi:hypothetical protein